MGGHFLGGDRRPRRIGLGKRQIGECNLRDPAQFQIGAAQPSSQIGSLFDLRSKELANLAGPYKMVRSQERNDTEKDDGDSEKTEELESFAHARKGGGPEWEPVSSGTPAAPVDRWRNARGTPPTAQATRRAGGGKPRSAERRLRRRALPGFSKISAPFLAYVSAAVCRFEQSKLTPHGELVR